MRFRVKKDAVKQGGKDFGECCLQEVQASRPGNRVGAAAYPQFSIDVSGVVAYGVQTDNELLGDFFVFQAICHQAQYFYFTIAERFNQWLGNG